MKTRYIIGSVIVVVFGIIAFVSLEGSKIEYTDISYARDSGKKVQVKGVWIKEKGSDYDSQNNRFSFTMRDDKKNETKVVYEGARPNNFEIAESIVVKGRMENGVLQASDILTKCPSKYEGTADQIKTSAN